MGAMPPASEATPSEPHVLAHGTIAPASTLREEALLSRLPDRLRARLERARPNNGAATRGRSTRATDSRGTRVRETEVARAAATAYPKTTGSPADLVERSGPRGAFVARTTTVAASDAQGTWRLDEVHGADPDCFALLTGDSTLGSIDLRRAVYFDTETTGLEGGAGTYVFLVGCGWFEGDRFIVEQGFLRGPEDEAALLASVAERVASAPAVVSFFGKVFDRHRLEDKMRVHSVAPPFADRPHLDLCFPLRRLTKGAFANGRLQTMERELLDFTRVDDMPGSLAPAAWFDFLAERAHTLEGVFRHNLEDVRSLAALAAYLGRAKHGARAAGPPLVGPEAQRHLALARGHADRREDAAALTHYRDLLTSSDLIATLDDNVVVRARVDEARLARRAARTGSHSELK